MVQLFLKHTQRLTGALSVLAVLIGLSGCFAAVTPAPEADIPSPQPAETTQLAVAATVESSATTRRTPTKTATVRPVTAGRTPTPTTTTGRPSTTTTPAKSATKTKATPNATTSIAAKTTPVASSTGTTGKVPRPLSPADGAVFTDMSGDTRIELKWSPVKPKLANNEYYVVTLQYQQFGQTWTDRAETKNTNWLVNEHSYLRGMADDGLFYWSVTLVRQTGADANGVAIETPLSEAGPVRAFVWQTAQSGSSSTSGTDKGSSNNNKSSGGSSGGGGGLPGYP